jgi:hypothetical protein
MFKGLLGFLLTLVVLIVGGLYIGYGEVEPCKVLAVERERRAGAIENAVDTLTGSTEGMSTTECVSGLLDSWGERLK